MTTRKTMQRFSWLAFLVLPGFAMAACDGTEPNTNVTSSSSSSSSSSSGEGGSGGGTISTIDTFVADAASSVCAALFRCCDATNITDYFAPYAADDLLASFKSKIPPQKQFADAAECSAVLAEMMAIVPFGDWVAGAKAGQVEFVSEAFETCKSTLAKAACGTDLEKALFDDGCLSFYAPAGPKQRSIFVRKNTVGAPCTPIKDGVGARYYGTCNPLEAFCCYAKPEDPMSICAYPFDANGVARMGTCKAISQAGGACSLGLTTVQLCKTGEDCDSGTNTCVAPATTPLMPGDICYENFLSTGECQKSYCDILGTSKCEPFKADGVACSADYECMIASCNAGVCGPSTYCDGK